MIADDLSAMSAIAPDANMQIPMAGCSCQTLSAVRHILMQSKTSPFGINLTKDHALYRTAQVMQCDELSKTLMRNRQTTT